MKIISIAARNVTRNWRRTAVTTTAMAFAGFIMILFAALTMGLIQTSERNAVSMDLGDIQIHPKGYRDDPDLYNLIKNPADLVSRLKDAGFFAAYRIYSFALAASGSTSAGVQLRGINLNDEPTVTEIHKHIMQGSWLSDENPFGVVIGKKLARTLGVGIGQEIIIIGQASDGSMANNLYTVRGILKSVSEEIDRTGFYMTEASFRDLMVLPQGAHEIAVMRHDRTTDLSIATERVAAISQGYEVMNWRDLRPVIARILDLADAQMIIMILITYVAVAMVVLNAMLMSVFERIKEFGVMKAVGVKPFQIVLIIYAETVIQVIAAAIIALIAGYSIASYLEDNGIDLSAIASGASFGGIAMDPIWYAHVTSNSLILPISFLFLIAILAVIYPSIKAAVIRPVAAFHNN